MNGSCLFINIEIGNSAGKRTLDTAVLALSSSLIVPKHFGILTRRFDSLSLCELCKVGFLRLCLHLGHPDVISSSKVPPTLSVKMQPSLRWEILRDFVWQMDRHMIIVSIWCFTIQSSCSWVTGQYEHSAYPIIRGRMKALIWKCEKGDVCHFSGVIRGKALEFGQFVYRIQVPQPHEMDYHDIF